MNTEVNETALDGKNVSRLKNSFEIYNTIILSVATLSITWCSYQAVLWNGIQTFKLADVNKYNRLAQANLHSDNYSLYTVVFSMVMFVGAIASKVNNIRISFTLIIPSGLICLAALIFMFIYMPLAPKGI